MREQIMTEETTRATVKRKELARGVIEKRKLPVLDAKRGDNYNCSGTTRTGQRLVSMSQVANNCKEM